LALDIGRASDKDFAAQVIGPSNCSSGKGTANPVLGWHFYALACANAAILPESSRPSLTLFPEAEERRPRVQVLV
jgi:hypothetical protein